MAKVLITGASGMLGRYVRCKVDAAGHEVIAPTRADMDLMQPQNVYNYIRACAPEAILHLAAETDVDLCERDPRRGAVANQQATKSVAQAARDIGAWLLSISTSNVFGADIKPLFNELDIPSPMNYYGRSKLFGEKEIDTFHPDNSLIIRAGWMIGGGRENDHKFVGKIVEQIAKGTQLIRAVSDKYGTITSAPVLADFIIESLTARRLGLVHFASMGVVSRFDIAYELARIASYKGNVEPVMSSEFPLSAPRPIFDGINSIYIGANDKHAPRFWRDDLRNYLTEFGF
jgi:dTDP-4-dehydrorhamnose reductase